MEKKKMSRSMKEDTVKSGAVKMDQSKSMMAEGHPTTKLPFKKLWSNKSLSMSKPNSLPKDSE